MGQDFSCGERNGTRFLMSQTSNLMTGFGFTKTMSMILLELLQQNDLFSGKFLFFNVSLVNLSLLLHFQLKYLCGLSD